MANQTIQEIQDGFIAICFIFSFSTISLSCLILVEQSIPVKNITVHTFIVLNVYSSMRIYFLSRT